MDFINEQNKAHRGSCSREVMNRLLELKPDALGCLSATTTPKEADGYRAKFKNWYRRFRARHLGSASAAAPAGAKIYLKDTRVLLGRR